MEGDDVTSVDFSEIKKKLQETSTMRLSDVFKKSI